LVKREQYKPITGKSKISNNTIVVGGSSDSVSLIAIYASFCLIMTCLSESWNAFNSNNSDNNNNNKSAKSNLRTGLHRGTSARGRAATNARGYVAYVLYF